MGNAKLAPIADRVAKQLGDIRGTVDWQEELWDVVVHEQYGELDTKQADIVFDMVVARWDHAKREARSRVELLIESGSAILPTLSRDEQARRIAAMADWIA